MGQKREVPGLVKAVLEWDVATTEKVVKWLDQNHGPIAKYRTVMKGLEISCHGVPWLVATAAFIFFLDTAGSRQLMVNLFLALIMDIVVVAVVKAAARRRRPSRNVSDELIGSFAVDKFSFPSGHATRAVMISVLLPLQYDIWLAAPFLYAWGFSVCVSRVLMSRHHILDVVGGSIIGFLQALVMCVLWLSEGSAQGIVMYFLDETQAGASYDV